MDLILYLWWELSLSMLVKGAPLDVLFNRGCVKLYDKICMNFVE